MQLTKELKYKLKGAFNKKFVKYDAVLNAMILAYETGENLVLYGRGGHNKSGFVTEFFKQLDITPYIKALGQGSKIEDLLGGVNLPLFNSTGKLEYLPENSWMNHEYVILEEGFDAPLNVLEQLKDILTSKQFRNGNQIFDVKTKVIFICTNRQKDELCVDDSLSALIDRFHLWCKVEWNSYKGSDYSEMFNKVIGNYNLEFASILENASQETFISPRSAIKACKVYQNSGLEGLQYVTEFNSDVLVAMKKDSEKFILENKLNLFTNFITDKFDYDKIIKKIKDTHSNKSNKSYFIFSELIKVRDAIRRVRKNLIYTYDNYDRSGLDGLLNKYDKHINIYIENSADGFNSSINIEGIVKETYIEKNKLDL